MGLWWCPLGTASFMQRDLDFREVKEFRSVHRRDNPDKRSCHPKDGRNPFTFHVRPDASLIYVCCLLLCPFIPSSLCSLALLVQQAKSYNKLHELTHQDFLSTHSTLINWPKFLPVCQGLNENAPIESYI